MLNITKLEGFKLSVMAIRYFFKWQCRFDIKIIFMLIY